MPYKRRLRLLLLARSPAWRASARAAARVHAPWIEAHTAASATRAALARADLILAPHDEPLPALPPGVRVRRVAGAIDGRPEAGAQVLAEAIAGIAGGLRLLGRSASGRLSPPPR